MKIEAAWIATPATQAVFATLAAGGAGVWAVGGALRDSLMGRPVGDIDFATDARPERVIELAKAAGLKSVPTGLAHGTVTLVVGGEGFEVTTLRRDVETDGRRATIAFARTLEEDAARRDFTVNALYACADGTLLDPLGGLPDVEARCLRFIGDAEARIREDTLRILRLFRFHAQFGDPAEGLDAQALAACAAQLDGLSTLSAERITAELAKLLAAPDPAPAVAAMARIGVLTALLPGADDRALGPLVHFEEAIDPKWLRRLAVLGGETSRLRLSRAEARHHDTLRSALTEDTPLPELAYRFGAALAFDAALVRAASTGTPPPEHLSDTLTKAAAQRFPLKARDLMPALEGPALGEALKALEADWIASGFTLDRAALLARLPG